ncbi:MAG TPA: YdcF family protein [Xanthobacteraceae bacterium]|nr:YdcF family protein [Xanthobacteraceae bacterium]
MLRFVRLRRLWQVTVAACWLAMVLLGGGFLWFAFHVASEEVRLDRSADGIVALTGGASRLDDAVDLLAAARGRRLLISGVDPRTNTADLMRRVPDHRRWFDCCIDLDYSAVNTIGNAVETRRWALDHGFRSLIVVTSSYHMPRAMLELAHQLPGVTLIPYPVVTQQRRAAPWWSHPANVKILALEYFKYIVASARIGLDAPPGATTVAASRGRAKI